MMALPNRLQSVLEDPEFLAAGKRFLFAILVGGVAGVGALIFHFLSELLFEQLLGVVAGYEPRKPAGEGHVVHAEHPLIPWLLILIPSVGGLLSGAIVYRFAPEAEGHGTDAVLDAYHNRHGLIPWRVPVVKTIASILTLGTGGSGGREGPIAQIGGGFGSFMATRFNLTVEERRILLAAGMGAGVGAIFRAPLAGALFASEIHYRDPEFESEAVIPSAIASITSYCIFSLVYGWDPLFATGEFLFRDPRELIPYFGLAIAVSIGALLFINVFYSLHDVFKRWRIAFPLKTALGGGATGAVAVGLYFLTGELDAMAVLGFGYGALQGAIDGEVAINILLLVAFGKMLTTGLTIGSGGSGGVFGPSMVIGGAIGGAVGLALHEWLPDLVQYPGAYVIVGMAGFFAGAAKTPISTIIMVSEMTGNYSLLLPALFVSSVSYIILQRYSLYKQQMLNRAASPAHRGDFHLDILEDLKVGEVLTKTQVVTFSEATPLGDILHKASETEQNYFPITNAKGQMRGIFSLNDIRAYLYEEALWQVAIAADFARTDVRKVTPRDDLTVVLRRMTERNLDELPVVSEDESAKVIGLIRRKDVLDAYNKRLWALRQEG